MRQNAGWMTAIGVALAAVLGFSILPSLPSRNTPNAPSASGTAAPAESSTQEGGNPEVAPACQEIATRIAKFLPKGERVIAPPECYSAKKGDKISRNDGDQTSRKSNGKASDGNDAKLEFLIATLPNPVHTHLALQFDRLIEALQRAAQDQDFTYDSSWLPWIEHPRQYGGLQDQDEENRREHFRESQPGLLVFRNSLTRCLQAQRDKEFKQACRTQPFAQGLFVFIVAENPTGGVDWEQFKNAVGWIQALRTSDGERALRLLSPVFSGSFPSLAYSLLDAKKSTNISTFEVFSGTASSKQGIDWFSDFLREKKLGGFLTFQESDELAINRYCRLLKKQGYGTGELAIISEDETAYGTNAIQRDAKLEQDSPDPTLRECIEPAKDGGAKYFRGPLSLYYPRDIASLRTAYAKQSPANTGQSEPPGPGLPANLGESEGGSRDSVHAYGGEQTPLSQESTLFEIVNLLKAHRIEFILLRSSNVLDQVFLTSFFARTYPDARVVILNSDLMFRRSTATQGFRGTMTLSTYPLLTWQQDWTFYQAPESRHSHRAFADANSQGLYLAARFLIDREDQKANMLVSPDSKLPAACGNGNEVDHSLHLTNSCEPPVPPNSSVLVQDYGPPFWLIDSPRALPTRPPTWLSVLGATQVWPVAVIDENTVPENDEEKLKGRRDTVQRPTRSILPSVCTGASRHDADLLLPRSLKVFFAIVLFWCLFHLYLCLPVSPHAFPRCRGYFAPVLGSDNLPELRHDLLIFLGCMLFAVLAAVLWALTSGPEVIGAPFKHYFWMASFYVLLFGLSLAALIFTCFEEARVRKAGTPEPAKAKAAYHKALADENEVNTAVKHSLRTAPQDQPQRPETARQISIWLQQLRQAKKWLWNDPNHPQRPVKLATILFATVTLLLGLLFYFTMAYHLTSANQVFTAWRAVNLFSGVSPLTPLVLLIVGAYGWLWYTLVGLALFNRDRPRLPRSCSLPDPMEMFSCEGIGAQIEESAKPFDEFYVNLWTGLFMVLLLLFVLFSWIDGFKIRTLGGVSYAWLYSVWLCGYITFILADAVQMLRIWKNLRVLLLYLDRIPVRRTLYELKGFPWSTVWRMSGSVLEQRYKLLSMQIESFNHLKNELGRAGLAHEIVPKLPESLRTRLTTCEASIGLFVACYLESYKTKKVIDPAPFGQLQKELARTAGTVAKEILADQWKTETDSLIETSSQSHGQSGPERGGPSFPAVPKLVSLAEEFFILPYLAFIQNILGRIRTLALGMFWLFITATLSVVSYPFDPRPVMGFVFLAVFAVCAVVIYFVYSGMHRDTALSHITNTTPGELGWAFWIRYAAIGIGPLLAVLTALFPESAGFITSWLQPTVQAIK